MLLAKGKITQDMIALLVEDPVFSGDKWRHNGFNAFAGPRILPRNEKSMENLARYNIRASFSHLSRASRSNEKRMTYHRETNQVEYQSKDGAQAKVFDALEWLVPPSAGLPLTCPQRAHVYPPLEGPAH